MKVAALPRIYMKRCPKMACKSPVTSHSRLFIPTFKLQGSGMVCSIPTLKRKSIATKKTLLKESFLLLVIGCSGVSLSVLREISNLRGASDFYAPHQHSSLLIRSRAFIRDEGGGTSTGEP